MLRSEIQPRAFLHEPQRRQVSDLIAITRRLDIVMGEVDRMSSARIRRRSQARESTSPCSGQTLEQLSEI